MHKQPLKYIIQLILFNTLFMLLLGDVGAAGAGVYQQDPGANGIVSVEAEHSDNDVAQGGHSWVAVTTWRVFWHRSHGGLAEQRDEKRYGLCLKQSQA